MKFQYYNNCSELPLSVFIDIMVTDNINKLIKRRGLYGKRHVDEIWNDIQDEYSELSGSNRTTMVLSMLKDQFVLKNNIYLCQTIIKTMSININNDLVAVLKRLGFRNKFSKETIDKDLKQVVNTAKSWFIELNKVESEIKALYGSNDNEKVKVSDYDAVLARLSKFQGYRIDAREISVSQYLQVIKNYTEWLTQKK